MSDVTYKFSCVGFNSSYIGSTKRFREKRLEEHLHFILFAMLIIPGRKRCTLVRGTNKILFGNLKNRAKVGDNFPRKRQNRAFLGHFCPILDISCLFFLNINVNAVLGYFLAWQQNILSTAISSLVFFSSHSMSRKAYTDMQQLQRFCLAV